MDARSLMMGYAAARTVTDDPQTLNQSAILGAVVDGRPIVSFVIAQYLQLARERSAFSASLLNLPLPSSLLLGTLLAPRCLSFWGAQRALLYSLGLALLGALALAYAAAGKSKRAAEILTRLEDLRGQRYVLPYNLAKAYAAGRNHVKAFKWLEIAYQGGNPDLIELNSEPLFDGMRDDPRFVGLLRRVGWNV